MIEIYTDGSSKGNPGPGGYAIVVKDKETQTIIDCENVQEPLITNNQAELKAILLAFELAQTKFKNETSLIYSDSAYCVNICNSWIYSWAKNNWINSKKKQIENIDLIKSLYNYLTIDFFNCQVIHCKSHCGILENELADALATNNKIKIAKIINNTTLTRINIKN
jgi:ribonuclease HI